MSSREDLQALERRRDEEESAYARLLAALDALAAFPLPQESLPEAPADLDKLNSLHAVAKQPPGGGFGGAFRARAFDAVAPALERQGEWNAAMVRLWNGQAAETAKLHQRLRE